MSRARGRAATLVHALQFEGLERRSRLAAFAEANPSRVRLVLQSERVTTRFFQVGEGECSWLCDNTHSARLRDSLFKLGIAFEENSKASLISLVGESISDSREVMSDFMSVVEESGARVIAMASNSLSLCVAVEASNKALVTAKLHAHFIEGA